MRRSEQVGAWQREVVLFAPVYAGLALITLRTKLALTPSWFNGVLAANHQALLAFTYTNNEQSRLLQFYIPELIHRVIGGPIESAYIVQRWLFVAVAFTLFHCYLRKWFTTLASFGGVAFLAAIMQLTFINDLQEATPLLLVTYLLGLWCIRERWDIAFAAVMFVGTLNNETMLSLTAAFLFFRWAGWTLREARRVIIRTVDVSAPAWAAEGVIRYITRDNPHLGPPLQLPGNLEGILRDLFVSPLEWHKADYLHPFLIFGAVWLYAALAWRTSDRFLRRTSLMIPLFIAAHLITGVISEVRQLLPLTYMLAPMAMLYLDRQSQPVEPLEPVELEPLDPV